mgnify:CR=1 FL=1
MKKALAIGLAAVMAVSMSAPVFAEDEGKGIAKEDLKVGVIYIGDENEGYTAAHMKGIDEMEEKLGLDDSQIIEKTLIGEDEGCYDAAADLADQGCQIIFANSFGHETYILEAAGEYPEVQFCHATGTQAASSGLSNMHNYFTNIYEARYVSGVVAGLKLNEMIEDGTVKEDACKMGYVGAFPYAEVISGYTAFYLGAKSVCPSVTMEVKYTNSWASFDLEKECADALISSCSRQRLEQFERMLGIPINPNIPLERRREIAASRMSIAPSDFNRSGLEKALDAAGIRAVVQDRPGTGTLVVQANEIADSNLSLDEAKQAFYSLMPAHLEAEFVTGGLDFSQFEQLGKSWAQLDAMDKSWSQLEMMRLQQWKEKEEEGQDVQQ